MLKGILRMVLNVIIILILFLLQLYVFNNMYVFGARFNLVAMYVIIFSMINNLKLSLPVSFIIGILTDIILGNGKLQYMLIFMIIAIVLETLKLIYKQDNSMSVAVYSTAGILVLETISAIFTAISNGIVINIFSFIFFVIKVLVLNILLAYLMYYITIRLGEKLER